MFCIFEDIRFDFTMKSSQLGGAVELSSEAGRVREEVRPEAALASQYILQRRTARATQCSAALDMSEVNTERKEHVCREMGHTEGGWQVSNSEPGQRMRWRRKIEKDEQYVAQVTRMSQVRR